MFPGERKSSTLETVNERDMKRCPELYLFTLYIIYNINTLYDLELSFLCHFLRRVGEGTLRF